MRIAKSAGRKGSAYRRVREDTLAASRVCGLCGHDGSDSVDHIIPRAICIAMGWLHLLNDGANLRPAHHLPCPTCGIRCNRKRGIGITAAKSAALSRDW